MHDSETLLAHAGCTSSTPTGDLVDPIQLSTTFERGIDGEYPGSYTYSRAGNPTRSTLEQLLTQLEGGQGACAFASGMSAAAAVFSSLAPDAHVVIPEDVYHGVRHLLAEFASRWSLRVSAVDVTNEKALRKSLLPNTGLVWIETPSNPQLRITDLEMVDRVCKKHKIPWAADGTWTTSLIQCPLDYGATYVVHSLTKFMSGHSDVLGGAVISATEEDAGLIRSYQKLVGGVLDPFSCWLTLRGLRTLSVRLERQCENASAIADYLQTHPAVRTVLHPSLPSHPGHATVLKQMRRFGSMLSILIDGDEARAREIVSTTRVFRRATSLGGTESLIEHRRSIEGPDSATPPNLIRISVGLESRNDLLQDLQAALDG